MPCCGCTNPTSRVPRGCSVAQGGHPASTVVDAAPKQSCRAGQPWLTCSHQWGTRTHLSLLQSCLDFALLTLQGFLQLLQLMDGFAVQTDLVRQISNFLWQGQKGVWSGMRLQGQPRAGDFPISLPGLG